MAKNYYKLLVFLFMVKMGCLALNDDEKSKKPNIIFVLADDMGWNDVGFHGSEIPTPNLDSFAHDGIILNNYYTQEICTPSRAALLTGRYPIRYGLQHFVLDQGEPRGLPLNLTLLPQWLKRLGYATHMVGKWHLGFFQKEYTPTFRGFDSHFGTWGGFSSYFQHLSEAMINGDAAIGVDLRDNMKIVKNENGTYMTSLLNDRIKQIIRNHNKSQPLFLYAPYTAVHSTSKTKFVVEVPPKYEEALHFIKDQDRRKFAALLATFDDAFGQLVSSLHESGLLENYIIVFSSDNGAPIGFGPIFRNAGSNFPMRGGKDNLWEGGMRVPGFIWSPLLGRQRGRVSKLLMHITDWLPTLYQAAGGNVWELGPLDGVSMWDALRLTRTSPRREILLNYDDTENYAALRIGRYKLIFGGASGTFDDWSNQTQRANPEDIAQFYNPPYSVCQAQQVLQNMGRFHHNPEVALDDQGCNLFMHPERYKATQRFRKANINCGKIPPEATSNCKANESPCLYDVIKDPCEYYNIAELNPMRVEEMIQKLQKYMSQTVPASNLPNDPKSDPALHGGAWTTWGDPDHEINHNEE